MEYDSGSLHILSFGWQPAGHHVFGHRHRHDHTTFVRAGWLLIRGREATGDKLIQIATPEYGRVRALQERYEPGAIRRPIRFADLVVEVPLDLQKPEGPKVPQGRFDIRFIGPGDPVPEGGEEILYRPTGYQALIWHHVEHELILLSDGQYDCTYAHFDAHGLPSAVPTGYHDAYR